MTSFDAYFPTQGSENPFRTFSGVDQLTQTHLNDAKIQGVFATATDLFALKSEFKEIRIKGLACLDSVKVEELLHAKGRILTRFSNLAQVKSEDSVILFNTDAEEVESEGELRWTFHYVTGKNPKKIRAVGPVSLAKVTCPSTSIGSVASVKSTIEAEECTIDSMFANKNISLKDCRVDYCDTLEGKITIINKTALIAKYNLKAAIDIILKNVQADAGSEITSGGKIEATDCVIQTIKAENTIRLESSSCQTATLNVSDEIGKVKLVSSKILGDLIILTSKTRLLNFPSLQTYKPTEFFEKYYTDETLKDGKTRTRHHPDGWRVFAKSEADLKQIQFEAGSTGLVNGQPYKCMGPGAFVSLKASVLIKISGQGGKIGGQILFKDCEGKFELEDDVTIGARK